MVLSGTTVWCAIAAAFLAIYVHRTRGETALLRKYSIGQHFMQCAGGVIIKRVQTKKSKAMGVKRKSSQH